MRAHFASGPLPQSSQAGSTTGPPAVSMSQIGSYSSISARASPAYPVMPLGMNRPQMEHRGGECWRLQPGVICFTYVQYMHVYIQPHSVSSVAPFGVSLILAPALCCIIAGNHPGGHFGASASWQDALDPSQGAGAGQAGQQGGAQGGNSVAVLLDTAQFSTLCSYLHSIQTISQANLSISPAPMPEWYSLTISGSQAQVQAAKGLVDSLWGMPRS